MQSGKQNFGKYVTVRPRDDGTFRVLFEVPKRLRPDGWPATQPLPLTGERNGRLDDSDECSRIRRDAAGLVVKLQRSKDPTPHSRRRMRDLVHAWQECLRYKKLKTCTKLNYDSFTRIVLRWAESSGDGDPTRITQRNIEELLAVYDDQPSMQVQILNILKLLLDQMKALGWTKENPAREISASPPESNVRVWNADEVEIISTACGAAGRDSMAALIETEWEIGQRLTDARLFRHGEHFVNDVFRFWQSKTNSYVTVPISRRLCEMINAVRVPNSDYLFVNSWTGRPYTDHGLAYAFRPIRLVVGRKDGALLKLRALRHSCVVDMARSGCTVPEIAAITGHSLQSVHLILKHYLPRDNVVAWNAQAKRGLIEASA
jgi:hypothetical protein